ncbi:MAG TPA: acylphosphatase, partial [candidate division Zixibacteria bacterium]|nr:acylphosphatase [candidate division Zixibacteria bacterium]
MNGVVQGVGFRPFIYRLAHRLALAGSIRNDARGVHIEVEGPAAKLDQFRRLLRAEAPALARIDSLRVEPLPPRGQNGFSIEPSRHGETAAALIPPDIAVCADCLREMHDPSDRRYRYPFTNCTNCGPRFTIVEGIPYDRPKTSMKRFPMCPACEREYHDPLDRRFH